MADGVAIRSYARKSTCVSAALGGFYTGSRHCNFLALPVGVASSGYPCGWPGCCFRSYHADQPDLVPLLQREGGRLEQLDGRLCGFCSRHLSGSKRFRIDKIGMKAQPLKTLAD